MNRKYKVAIVGGGPAGSLTAVSLCTARPELAGDVLLLEARGMPREKVCGGGLARRVADRLASLGIDLESIPYARVNGMSLVFGGREASSVFYGRESYVVRRSAFDALLLERARECGVEVRTGAPVKGAYRERDGITLVGGDGSEYRARVLVAADGVNGKSRTWFGLPARHERRLLLQTDFKRVESDHVLDSSLIMDYSAVKYGISGYAWIFPSVDEEGEPVFNAGITGLPYSKGASSTLKAVFEQVMQDYHHVHGLTPGGFKYKSYPERVFSPLQVNASGGVIFVGEQLGVDPMTGEGLGICADSAACAAEEIICAMDTGDYSGRGYNRRLLRCGFFPLYTAGKIFTEFLTARRFPLLLSLIANSNGDGREFVLNHYCKIFAGVMEPASLCSLQLLREIFNGIRQTVYG
ncbi:MAG: NAD(P)/FAD-dependent oxidoreductase [Actinobacteria bacterium]|nr:NAD(P)/FAD-dependent oxidoreductase [Actinomycetota bacterium]